MTLRSFTAVLLVIIQLAAGGLLTTGAAHAGTHAGWQLNNDLSRLSFVSIKATDIGEVHSFKRLEGTLSDEGEVKVSIDLASVETLIPIRNERMQELLFETGVFPSAAITAKVDARALSQLAVGNAQVLAVEASLNLKGASLPVTLQMIAARVSNQRLMVSSLQPVLVSARSVGLSEGVEKLREIAGLPNISQAVPVSVVLTFDK